MSVRFGVVVGAGIVCAGIVCGPGCGGSLAVYGPDYGPGGFVDPTPTTPSSTAPSTTHPTEPPPPTAPTGDTGASTTSTAPGPWQNGDPTLPPPYTAPPPTIPVLCSAAGFDAELLDDELVVESHDGPNDSETLVSSVRGWYDLYDREMSQQGDGEWNESAMVRIVNASAGIGLPAFGNCGAEFVTVDPDNTIEPGDDLLYMGTFWFETGDNLLELEHLCPTVRAGACGNLEFLDDADTRCGSGDGNSAHLDGTHLCLVAPRP